MKANLFLPLRTFTFSPSERKKILRELASIKKYNKQANTLVECLSLSSFPISSWLWVIKTYLNDACYLQFSSLSCQHFILINATIVSPFFNENVMKHLWRFSVIIFLHFARSYSRLNRSLLEHESNKPNCFLSKKKLEGERKKTKDNFSNILDFFCDVELNFQA